MEFNYNVGVLSKGYFRVGEGIEKLGGDFTV